MAQGKTPCPEGSEAPTVEWTLDATQQATVPAGPLGGEKNLASNSLHRTLLRNVIEKYEL